MKSFKVYCESVDEGGILVVNMPVNKDAPKAPWMTPSKLYSDLKKYFQNVKTISGDVFVCSEKILDPDFCEDLLYSSDDIFLMGKTSRPWKSTTVYRVAVQLIQHGDMVLDFGAGKYQLVKQKVENRGGIYIPYDTSISEISDPSIINQKYDIVMGSNVLNVQGKLDKNKSTQAYYSTLCKLIRAVK